MSILASCAFAALASCGDGSLGASDGGSDGASDTGGAADGAGGDSGLDRDSASNADGNTSRDANADDGAPSDGPATDASSGQYTGPTVGMAAEFAVLAYNSVTTANISTITGSIGVSSAAVSTITGFDAPGYVKYGSDSLAPHAGLTGRAQGDVTALVGNIDPRACDADLTNVVGGLTGDVTLHPGVTCMNSFSADVLLNGHVYLDAGNDPNAFFIIRGNKTMTVANGAQVVLMNGARDCSVFWRIHEAITIGTTVRFHGTLIAGTAITMRTGSTLDGRALAQTAGVQLDADTITIPSSCPHVQ